MQVNDTVKTVVAFVVLPEFAFKVRRFFRDQVQVNLQKPIIDGATCDVEKWPLLAPGASDQLQLENTPSKI